MITQLVAQPDLLSHDSAVQESDPGLPGLKPRAQQGCAPPGGSGRGVGGESIHLPFQLPDAACMLWLLFASLLSLQR